MEEIPIIPTTLRFADIFPILLIVIVGLGVIAFWLYRKGYFREKHVVAATNNDTDSKNEQENQLPIDVMMFEEDHLTIYPNYLYINNTKVSFNQIEDITFHNSSSPYEAQSYHLVITTTLNHHPVFRLPVGSSVLFARDASERLIRYWQQYK